MTIRKRLMLGFGVMLALLALVAGVGQVQLAQIQHFNSALDARAFRLAMASEWAVQVKVAVAKKAAVPSLDIEQVKKLGALTQDDNEKRALAAAMASHTASPEDHMQAVDQLAGKLVSLQIADSGQLQAALTRAVTLNWSVLALGIVLGIVIALRISGGIVRPLNDATQVAQAIAGGDLSRRIPAAGADEVGAMVTALTAMQANLAKLVSNVRQGSEGVATASAEIAQGNNDLSTRTEQQASALEETAASMEELGTTVQQNADSAARPTSWRRAHRPSRFRAAMWWARWWRR